MNNTRNDVQTFIRFFKKNKLKNTIFGVAVPFVYLSDFEKLKNCKLGAQNVYQKEKGAYTGEISAAMLSEFDVYFCIVGHSERRKNGETNSEINQKIKLLLNNNILPVLCIGETLEEYSNKKTKAVLKKQLKECLQDVDISKIIIAYEPVWAIGTGKTPTKKEIVSICEFIKDFVFKSYNKNVKVLYGGSVNENNTEDLIGDKAVDGALVGGASLDVYKFFTIGKKAD